MKRILLVTSLLLCSSVVADDIKYNQPYTLNELKINEGSLFFPVYKFMIAFKENKAFQALEYCTEEVLYKKDSVGENFFDVFKNKFFMANYSDPNKIRIGFFKKNEGTEVQVEIPSKNGTVSIHSVLFKVKKINGKFTIIYIF